MQRKPPQPLVRTKHLFPIPSLANIEFTLCALLALKILDRRVVVKDKFDVELNEVRQRAQQHACQQVRCEHDWIGPIQQSDIVDEQLAPLEELRKRGDDNDHHRAVHIEQELHEEFAVVEAHAVVDPWAMMIHVKNAPIADAAVVAPVRLPNIAHLAIPTPLGFISHVEAPIGWYNAWICHDAFVERKDEAKEEHVEHEEHTYSIDVWHVWKPYQPDEAAMDIADDA